MFSQYMQENPIVYLVIVTFLVHSPVGPPVTGWAGLDWTNLSLCCSHARGSGWTLDHSINRELPMQDQSMCKTCVVGVAFYKF